MNEQKIEEQPVIWWKDKKLLTGVIVVVLSAIIGLYGKALFIVKFYEPVQLITGLSIWAFSWVLLFIGVFLVGWETIKMIQYKIHHHVKHTVKRTYHHAKELPKTVSITLKSCIERVSIKYHEHQKLLLRKSSPKKSKDF